MSREEHIDTLARTLYGEAKANDVTDATAIACVVMNRVELPNWPNDVESVCLQPYQFSCWNANDPNRTRIFKATRENHWFSRCLDLAADAVDGKLNDPTTRSTHYHTPAVKPAWSRKRKPVYKTYGHLFYNDIDTPPPMNAAEALNQIKPVSQTKTIKTTKATAVVGIGIGAVAEAVQAVAPALPLAQKLVEVAPWAIVAVCALGFAYIAWSRYQARKEGIA